MIYHISIDSNFACVFTSETGCNLSRAKFKRQTIDHLMKIVTKVLNSFIQFLMLVSIESIDNFDKGVCLFECLGC